MNTDTHWIWIILDLLGMIAVLCANTYNILPQTLDYLFRIWIIYFAFGYILYIYEQHIHKAYQRRNINLKSSQQSQYSILN